MKNEDNELITDEQSIVEEFKKVFQDMLDWPDIKDQEQDNTVFVTVEQYQDVPGEEKTKEAIEMLKYNKAPGKFKNSLKERLRKIYSVMFVTWESAVPFDIL